MPEAEDVLVDAARHATVFARALWQRRRANAPATLTLVEVAERLDLLLSAVFDHRWPLRTAQPPPPPTLLTRLFKRELRPFCVQALPATDGSSIWLPPQVPLANADSAMRIYRCMALQQAMRAVRGSAAYLHAASSPLAASLYHVLEADAADVQLARLLPGMQSQLGWMRQNALAHRPARSEFSRQGDVLEGWLRDRLQRDFASVAAPPSAAEHMADAEDMARRFSAPPNTTLYKDQWTGELRLAPTDVAMLAHDSQPPGSHEQTRSARLARRPEVRPAKPHEDDPRQGAWMIQTTQPHEHAEDPMGMQRPMDRDEQIAADQHADSLSELNQARLVSTPGLPKEVLLSADPPVERAKRMLEQRRSAQASVSYPEWDYRIQGYREHGTIVRVVDAAIGSQEWVDITLQHHRRILDAIRRRFELLRAQRMLLRRQRDGDQIDLQAYVEARADLRAGLSMSQDLYQLERPARRDLAITLLIDVSGSTDGWIAAHQRIIDIEREALLLVCIALHGMREPYSVLAFSGEGPDAVTVRALKRFDESYDNTVAQRIAALEPERYTRAGAALRHATAQLMQQPARHRLLLLLSDGKPNDLDQYEGRYGIEDMRQAIVEAKMQGILPFCLTIDRQAASYLPHVFGKHQYAMLMQPQLLPTILLDWIRRLVCH